MNVALAAVALAGLGGLMLMRRPPMERRFIEELETRDTEKAIHTGNHFTHPMDVTAWGLMKQAMPVLGLGSVDGDDVVVGWFAILKPLSLQSEDYRKRFEVWKAAGAAEGYGPDLQGL